MNFGGSEMKEAHSSKCDRCLNQFCLCSAEGPLTASYLPSNHLLDTTDKVACDLAPAYSSGLNSCFLSLLAIRFLEQTHT